MKNKKGLFALAGVVSVFAAVGAAVGIKKLKKDVAHEEILIKEEDLDACENAECTCENDCEEEVLEGCAPSACAECGCGCGFDEPTANFADLDDLKENELPQEMIDEIEKHM